MATSFESEVELQKLYADRAKLFDQMNQSTKSLLGLHQQISRILGETDPEKLTEGYTSLDDVIKNVAESMAGAGETSEDAFDKMALGLKEAESLTGKLSKRMNEFAKNAMKVSVPVAAFNGFVKGLKLSTNAMGSLWNLTKNTAAGIGHFALSVISFPFKMLNGLLSMAQQGGGDSGLRQALEDIRKEFGDLRTNASAAIIDIARSMRGPLAETGLRARRIFGNLAEALKTITEYAKNMGNVFDLVRDQLTSSGDAAQRFGAYIKGLGLQDVPEAQKALARLSATSGKDFNEIGREITSFAYQMGEAFGINGKQISRDVGKMAADFDNFGNLSIQTLTNVSVYARKLGVEVEKLKGAISAFDDFEKAAEGAAQLSQAFGLNVDAFRLMQEQDPAARIEQLRKAFYAAGRSVENMTRQERALLAEQTGLDQETLSLVFSQKSASTSYADIQKQSEATKKKQLSQAEAMEKLSHSIERMVKSGSSMQGGFFKIFFDGFTRGIMISRDFRGLMRDLRRDMRIVFQAGREVGRMFVTEFPGVQDMIRGLREIFNPREWRVRMQGVVQIFRGFFRELGDPNTRSAAFGNFVHNLRTHFSDLFNPNSPTGRRFLNGVRQFFGAMSAIFNAGFRLALQSVTRGLQFVANLIRNPAEAIAALRSGGASAGGLMGIVNESLVAPLLETLREVGPQLLAAFSDMFHALWDRLKTRLAGAAAGFIGAIFAPAIINAGINAVGAVILRSLVTGVGSLVGRFVASRRGVDVASAVAERGGLGQAAGRAAEASRGIPRRGLGIPGGAVSEVVEGGNEVAGARTGNINPASGARLAMVAAFITVGLIALVIAIVALAQYLKTARLTPADVALSAFTVGSAAVIMMAIAGAAAILALAAPAAAVMPALMPVMAVMLLFAGALTLAIIGISLLFKQANITAADVGTSLAAVGGSVLLLMGLLGAGLILGGLTVLTPLIPALLLGLAGALALSYALAETVPALILAFSSINGNVVNQAAGKVVSATGLLGAIALSGIALAFIGGLTPLVPVILVGMAAIYALTTGITEIVKKVIQKISSIPTSETVRAQVQIVTQILSALGGFVGSISDIFSSGSSIAGAILNPGGITRQINGMKQLILGIITEIPTMVERVVAAVNNVTANQEALNRTQVIVQIVSALGTFIGAVSNAVPSVGIFENADNKFRAMAGFISGVQNQLQNLLGSVAGIVNVIAQMAGSIDVAKAPLITALAGATTSIISALAGMINSIFRTSAVRDMINNDDAPQLIEKIGQFIGRVVNSLVGRQATGNSFIGAIRELITTIAQQAQGLSAEGASNLFNLTRVLGPVFQMIGPMIGLVGALGPQVLAGNPAEVEAKIGRVTQFISSLTSGLGTQIGELITNLKDKLIGISSPDIAMLAQKAGSLRQLFDVVRTVQESISGFRTNFNEFLTTAGSITNGALEQNLAPIQRGTVERVSTYIQGFEDFILKVNSDLSALSSRNDINLNVHLNRLRTRLGLTGRQTQTLSFSNFQVNITVNVSLDVDDVENAIATRPGGSTFAITAHPGTETGRVPGARPQDVWQGNGG